jgi:sugar phosphate isomerase/epimerase
MSVNVQDRYISVQVYAVREELDKDFEGTLKKFAAAGYEWVELYHHAYGGHSAAEVKAILASMGLKSSGCHVNVKELEEKLPETIEFLVASGCPHLVCGWADYAGALSPWERADLFNEVGKKAKEAGMGFSIHNHDQEFTRIGDKFILDILLENTDPALFSLELDTYWAAKAGADPAAFQAKWKNRSPLLHLKDLAPSRSPDWAVVGEGVLDFPAIVKAASETRGFVFDLDDSPDPFRDFANAHKAIKKLISN